MENLNAEERARLESKIMDTITDFLNAPTIMELEFLRVTPLLNPLQIEAIAPC